MPLRRSAKSLKPNRRGPARRVRQAPRHKLKLRRHKSVGTAATAMIAASVADLDACWQRVADDASAEAVHAFRVSLRKLRVVLRIFRTLAPNPLDATRRSLGDMAKAAGRLRDLDVLVDDLVRPMPASASKAAMAALVASLERQRSTARAALINHLDGDGARALRQQLAVFPQHLEPLLAIADTRGGIGKFALRNLERQWRKVRRKAKKLDNLTAAELHDLRKSLKTLRYAFENFAPFWKRRDRERFLSRLLHLQSALGHINDAENAKVSLCRFAKGAQAGLAFASGLVIGTYATRQQAVLAGLDKHWHRLAVSKVARVLNQR